MNTETATIEEPDPGQILQVKQEIIALWGRLPAEHQATMLLVLLDHSAWAGWSVWTWLLMNPVRDGET